MISQHLHAPLHESEERAIDRAIVMEEQRNFKPMSLQELVDVYKKQAESARNRQRQLEVENSMLAEQLRVCREYIERFYRGIEK